MRIEIRRADDDGGVFAARSPFDQDPDRDATRRFLAEPTHHLLVAYDETGQPVGFVSGGAVELRDAGPEEAG